MNQLTTSLWGDESFTAVAVRENLPRILEIVAKDTAPPLYYLLLFAWTRIFGSSEIAIRSLSVLLSLGTALTACLIAKHIWGSLSRLEGRKTALWAGLLTLANPFLFPFAFEGRMYAILVFFVTLSFYFFITKKFWGYILSAAAAIYSHHYAALALVFQFCWRLGEAIKGAKKAGASTKQGLYWLEFIKPYLLIAFLYLPWLYPLYQQLTRVSSGFWLGKPQLKDLGAIYLKYFLGEKLIFNWQKYSLILAGLTLLLKKWSSRQKQNLFLIGWAIVPVLTAFLLSQGKTSLFYDRYLIFIIPALMILLAGGRRQLSSFLIIIYLCFSFRLNYHYFQHPTKRPFRQLAAHVEQTTKQDDFLINYNGSAHHLWETKYYGLEAPLFVPGEDLPYYVGTAQMTEKDIIKKLPNRQKIGVISSEEPEKIEIENYQLKEYKKFGSLSFSWFERQK